MNTILRYVLIFFIFATSSFLMANTDLSQLKPDVSSWIVSDGNPSIQTKYIIRNESKSEDVAVLRVYLRNDLKKSIGHWVVSPDFGFKITKTNSDGTISYFRKSDPMTSSLVANINPGEIRSYNIYLKKEDIAFLSSGQLTLSTAWVDREKKTFHTVSYALSNLAK